MHSNKSTKSHSEKTVHKPRLIASILSELEASGAIALFTCDSTNRAEPCRITCKWSKAFETSRFEILDISKSFSQGTVVCCFAGRRIVFSTCRKVPSNDEWLLPTEIRMVELRSARRWKFPEDQYSCEIIGKQGSVYGHAVDLSQDCIAVDMDIAHNLTLDDSFKILVRLINTNNDVFFAQCTLLQVASNESGGMRGIFKLNIARRSEENQRTSTRSHIEGISIAFTGAPFADAPREFELSVQNISSGGLTLTSSSKPEEFSPLPGMILKAVHLDVGFLVVWKAPGKIGCRPLLQNRHAISAWYQYLDRVNPPENRVVGTSRQDFADLLTHSGLIKGSRRLPFGKGMANHLITHPESLFPLLVQRHFSTNPEGAPDMHVSAKRISDTSWFFGDGTALTERPGPYNDMLDECTNRLTQLANESAFFPRYLTGIWHEDIKSTVKWGMALAKNERTTLFKSINVSLKVVDKHCSQPSSPPSSIDRLTAQDRLSLQSQFNPELFESLAALDGTHPVLNTELSKFGPYHRATSKVVKITDEISLVAHRVVTYGIWSNTGVTNAIFVLVPIRCSLDLLISGLKSLVADELSFGTDDFLVIFEQDYEDDLDESMFPKDRYFTYFVHDLKHR